MGKLLFAAICISLFAACSSNGTITQSDTDAYNKHKQTLASEEKEKPLSFLTISAGNKKNLFGSTVVKGLVANSATVCSYKDVRIKLLSFDKDGKMVEEHEDVIPAVIKPNSDRDFKLRYHLPHGVDSVALSVMSASVAE